MATAKYDLTPRIAPKLDRHLVFPLLEFTQERELYPKVASNDKMDTDIALNLHQFYEIYMYICSCSEAVSSYWRVEVVARLKSLEVAAAPIVTFLQNPSAVQELRADKHYNRCSMIVLR
uniref:Eukaryotic translation initiation factor 3 subunit E N-terminal domain-containing protein n=1 Tax=Lactuca sativa TaxID=4236 RepID=A0A9R1VE15_LACSA|nr:hypothetical protein LSAT_V11C500239800 [Lactuca sativa]